MVMKIVLHICNLLTLHSGHIPPAKTTVGTEKIIIKPQVNSLQSINFCRWNAFPLSLHLTKLVDVLKKTKTQLKALLSVKALSSTRWSSPASGFDYEICIYFVLLI